MKYSTSSRVRRILTATVFAVLLFLSDGEGFAQAPVQDIKAEHPFLKKEEIKSETCLTCHPDKKEGKYVHSAVGMGCENCHTATSEADKTKMELVAKGGELCAMCHEAKKDPVLHGPYKDGQCLTCHNPHNSDFKAQTRAAVNALCLECHAVRRSTGDTVKLFGTVQMSAADFDAIPKIELDPMQRVGHPWAGHPVAQIEDVLRPGEKMSCLSCHEPHAAAQQNLIRAAKSGDICDGCHQAVEEKKRAELLKKDEAQRQQLAKQQQQPAAGATKPSEAKR